MKKTTLALLCCSAVLYGCGSSNDSSKDTANDVIEKSAGEIDSAKERARAAASTASESVEETVNSTVAADGKRGESIYKSKCMTCHTSGVAGAPKLGDKVAWEARIAQGNGVLMLHAIEGFKGKTGYMPPKGGFLSLSDNEISLVVQFMVSQSQ